MFRLDDRVVLVTGAASGIGAKTAELMAQAGADVVLGWYPGDPHDVAPTVAAVEATGRQALVVEVDVSDTPQVDAMVARTVETFGRIDVVVANAGIARDVPAVELDDDRWRQLMEVDLLGVFRCFRAALPHMIERKWGRLLAASSIAGHQGWSSHTHYSAAKAGVMGIVRALALEVAEHGITVNAIAPGVVVSPQTEDAVNSLGPAGLETFKDLVPVRRNGVPADIAAAYVFLATEEASYVNGQILLVDGGASLAGL